jgi:hypothetical protein
VNYSLYITLTNSNPHKFRYRYGNFNHYKLSKEFCNPLQIFDQFIQSDPRVDVFCPDWFVNKSILDIGCSSAFHNFTGTTV